MGCLPAPRYNGTPIMDAVRHKHSEVVAFLKRSGAVLHHDKAKGKRSCSGCIINEQSGPPCRRSGCRFRQLGASKLLL